MSIGQFLSLFNVSGVENARMLDKVVEVLKTRLREKYLTENKANKKDRYKESMMKSYLKNWGSKE